MWMGKEIKCGDYNSYRSNAIITIDSGIKLKYVGQHAVVWSGDSRHMTE